MYVCMSHSKLQNLLVSEGVKFHIKSFQNLTFNSFFLNCEGGYFREPSEAPNVYVCMFELPDVYVCMSQNFHKKFRVQKHTGKGSPGAFLFIFC